MTLHAAFLCKNFLPHSDIFQGRSAIVGAGSQHADPQTTKFTQNLVIDVTEFDRVFIGKSGVGKIFAEHGPVAILSTSGIIRSHKLPNGGTAFRTAILTRMEGDSGGDEGLSSGKFVPYHLREHSVRLGDVPSVLVTECEGVDWQPGGVVVGSCLRRAACDRNFGNGGN